jgi:hypothetical protein
VRSGQRCLETGMLILPNIKIRNVAVFASLFFADVCAPADRGGAAPMRASGR